MTHASETIASIRAGLAMERLRLPALISMWLTETTPGMRSYRRDAVRRCVAGIRIDVASLERWLVIERGV
jgi:hypothetical protein